MLSPRPKKSHEGVLKSHKRLSPSQEARGKTQISLVGQERVMLSLRLEKSLKRVLASHKRLNPSPAGREENHMSLESWGKTQLSQDEPRTRTEGLKDEDRG